jgi:hypothetical protein
MKSSNNCNYLLRLLRSPIGTTQKLPTPPGYVGYQRTNRTFRGEGPESALLTHLYRSAIDFAVLHNAVSAARRCGTVGPRFEGK